MTKFNEELLSASGFELANAKETPRIVAAIAGQDKGGKTHLALTAPDPLCHIAFDVGGLEGMREKFVRGDVTGTPKTIYQTRIRNPRPAGKRDKSEQSKVKALALEQWEKFSDAFTGSLKAGARTIIVDQETDTWELARLKQFGTESNVAHLYAELNQQYKELLFSVYDYPGVNLILIQKLKKQYIARKNSKTGETEDKWEGAWERAGFSDLRYIVQCNIMCWRDTDEERSFHARIESCRQNALVVGMTLDNDQITWPSLGQLIFPNTDEAYWL